MTVDILPSSAATVACRLSGTITAADYDQIIEEIENGLKNSERLSLYVDVVGFQDMTAEAIEKRIQYGLSKLGELDRFAKAAVVTDKEWIATVVRFSSKILPTFEVRVFGPAEREAAKSWVSASTA